MYKKLKLGTKLQLYFMGIFLLAFIVMIFLVLQRTREYATQTAIDYGRAIARAEAVGLQTDMAAAMSYLKTTSAYLEMLGSETSAVTRERVLNYLKWQAKAHPDFATLWLAFEPNAFDNNDAAYADDPIFGSARGMFAPRVLLSSDGKTIVEALPDHLQADYFVNGLKAKEAFLSEPTIHNVAGQKRLLTSLAMPIKQNTGL
jgi:methyl-accepting chemotaxis protein